MATVISQVRAQHTMNFVSSWFSLQLHLPVASIVSQTSQLSSPSFVVKDTPFLNRVKLTFNDPREFSTDWRPFTWCSVICRRECSRDWRPFAWCSTTIYAFLTQESVLRIAYLLPGVQEHYMCSLAQESIQRIGDRLHGVQLYFIPFMAQ